MINDVVGACVSGPTAEGYAEDWALDQLWSSLKQLYPVGVTIEDVIDESGVEREQLDGGFLQTPMVEDAQAAYERREEGLGSEPMRELERQGPPAGLRPQWGAAPPASGYLHEGVRGRAYPPRA